MYARVVRFTDVDIDRINSTAGQIEGERDRRPACPLRGSG